MRIKTALQCRQTACTTSSRHWLHQAQLQEPWVTVKANTSLVVFAVSLVLSGCGDERAQTATVHLEPDNVDVVARGEKIYADHCASCHGTNLEGQPNWRVRDNEGLLPAPPHDHSGHTWHHSDQHLFELTKHGLQAFAGADYKSRMPSYKDVLSDQQITDVLSFIKSRWPENIKKRHDQLNRAAAPERSN